MGVCKTDLEKYRPDIEKCFRCNLCKMVPLPLIKDTRFVDACPISRYYHFHGYSGSGLQFLAHSIIDDRLQPDAEMAEIAFSCRACGYCDVACKSTMDAERTQVIQTLRELLVDRELLVEKGMVPTSFKQTIDNSCKQTPLAHWARENGIKVLPEQSAPVLLFGGSELHGDAEYFEVIKKFARLLQKAGVDFCVFDDEPDCGIDLYWMACRDAFFEAGKKTVTAINSGNVKTVVTPSATAYGMLVAKYYDYGIDLDRVKVMHSTQYLLELVKARRLKLGRTVNARATYHDPCYLGRQSERTERWHGERKVALGQLEYTEPTRPIRYGRGEYDAPRELLAMIPGLTFIEMYRTREHALCCGYGGGRNNEYADMIHSTGTERMREAASLEVDLLVTSCGFCERQFRSVQAADNRIDDHARNQQQDDNTDFNNGIPRLRVMDIIELVEKAVS